MTPLAPTLEAFFTDRLLCQQRVSPNTIASYRDTFRLLLAFAQQHTGTRPARLQLTQLDAPTVGAFLEHLETQRGNRARTRNVRLAAIHSFFNYCALRHPEHAALIARVLAIPAKRSEKRIVTFLNPDETKALIRSPDRSTWTGRRDHALLLTAVQTGLRVSELLALTCSDVQLATGPHLRTLGKGRKERVVPLTTQTVAVLKLWTRERAGQPADALFSHTDRQAPDPRRRRASPRQAPPGRAAHLPNAAIQARLDARAAPHRRDDAAHRRHRHLHDRAVARPRARANDPRLPARRPRAQAARPGPHHTP